MLEILKYVLGGFWRFCGFAIILYISLFFIVIGIVKLVEALRGK